MTIARQEPDATVADLRTRSAFADSPAALADPPGSSATPPAVPETRDSDLRPHLLSRYRQVRSATEAFCEPLAVEDYVLQTMEDVSPAKWHLAHTTWFFEQFLLVDGPAADSAYRPFHPRYSYLFNSYYVTVGDRHCRIKRGSISRPTVEDVFAYRRHVDRHVQQMLAGADDDQLRRLAPLVEIGLNHEQQHQELAWTDIKHVFSCNPLYPQYRPAPPSRGRGEVAPLRFVPFPGGLREVGHAGDGFAYDNEGPRHTVFVAPFELGDRLVTNAEFLEFVEAGGYQDVPLWLSLGAAAIAADPLNWRHPLYWHKQDGRWMEFTLHGLVELDPDAPVCHLSYFEADAYARWRGCRLPTEFEWETACVAAGCDPADGHFVGDDPAGGPLHPIPPGAGPTAGMPLRQMFGDVWEWTSSSYAPYPGYKPPPGAMGEYNGKFMCNQYVLRGGACVTPRSHIRATYRNFFPPDARWQFTGLRLARDVP